tara:strand:+ start:2562 stop:3497 length:936 start_codon:yes stop_codon:yes gene_type:complete
MSNILIIKHGSLGDLIQANGAIKDIKKKFNQDKVFLLTTPKYAEFMSECPYLDGVLIDKRLPRWNLFYLNSLKKNLERFYFTKVFDLQNSSRTNFYKRFLFKKEIFWSNSISFTSNDEAKNEMNIPVLDRMEKQLKRAGIDDVSFTKNPDLSWAIKNVKNILNQNFEGNYILIFPFCSPKLTKKKWPYYLDLINLIKKEYGSKYNIAIAPGPNEVKESEKFNVNVILNKSNPLDIIELISLIKSSSYVISNDTGPAHICAHLNVKGLALFGSHTTPEKVSIGSDKFKYIKVDNLKKLNVSEVFEKVKENLN